MEGAGDTTGDRMSPVLTSFATEGIHANGTNPSTETSPCWLPLLAATYQAGPRLLVLNPHSRPLTLPFFAPRLRPFFDTCTLRIAFNPQARHHCEHLDDSRSTTTVKTGEVGVEALVQPPQQLDKGTPYHPPTTT